MPDIILLTPEEWEEIKRKKLAVQLEEENSKEQVIGEYNANFPAVCPTCKAPLPEHGMIKVGDSLMPCPAKEIW